MARGILLYIALLVLGLFVPAGNAFAATYVTGAYFATQGNGTVMSLTLKGDISRHKVSAQQNPDRIIIDIAGGVWKVPGSTATGKSPLVKDIRTGNPQQGLLRIVIMMNKKVRIVSDSRTSTMLSVKFAGADRDTTTKSAPTSLKKSYTPSFAAYEKSIFTKEPAAGTKDTSGPAKTVTRKPVIVLDPGHGGMDPGATGKSGIFEKKVTLQYALALKELLEKSGTYKVHLTRTDDRYIDLAARVKKARAWKGDLFISLHADSHADKDTRGLSVYTLSEDRAQRETDKLMDKANHAEVIRGVDMKRDDKDVQTALLDLARRANINTGAAFAELLVDKMGNNAKLLDHTHRQKSLAVLTDIDITSVLVELGYLSNRYEEKQLRTEGYRRKLTGGIKDAIDGYFKKFPLQE